MKILNGICVWIFLTAVAYCGITFLTGELTPQQRRENTLDGCHAWILDAPLGDRPTPYCTGVMIELAREKLAEQK